MDETNGAVLGKNGIPLNTTPVADGVVGGGGGERVGDQLIFLKCPLRGLSPQVAGA